MVSHLEEHLLFSIFALIEKHKSPWQTRKKQEKGSY